MTKAILLAGFAVFTCASATLAQDILTGRLEQGDPQLEEGQYYDAYTFEGREGQTATVLIKSAVFMPYILIHDPVGTLVHHTHGVWFPEGYSLGMDWPLTATGTWQFAVSESFIEDGDDTVEFRLSD